MSSMFDPQSYLDATMTEPGVRRPPFPPHNPDSPDGLYLAEIGEVTIEPWESKKADAKKKSGIRAVVPLKLQIGPQTKAATSFKDEVFQLTDSVMIDLDTQGQIDLSPGANREQTMYREAVGLNEAGTSFSWRKLMGRMVKVQIEHEVYNNWPQERRKLVAKA